MRFKSFIKRYIPSIIVMILVICTVCVGAVYAKYIRTATRTAPLTVDAYGHMDIALCQSNNVSNPWTGYNFKIIPGFVIGHNPYLYIGANNENGYIFIKVEESIKAGLEFSDYIQYGIRTDAGWIKGDGTNIPENVYWMYVETSVSDRYYGIIHDNAATPVNNQVLVPTTVTEDMMAALDGNAPTLTLTAYSCHSANLSGTANTAAQAALAWAEVNTLYNTP